MIFNRKNIIFILIICLILVFICMYKDNNNLKDNETVETSGTPVSSHIVILDAGHGEPDRTVRYLIVVFQKRR